MGGGNIVLERRRNRKKITGIVITAEAQRRGGQEIKDQLSHKCRKAGRKNGFWLDRKARASRQEVCPDNFTRENRARICLDFFASDFHARFCLDVQHPPSNPFIPWPLVSLDKA
jgi:hypothetical protein